MLSKKKYRRRGAKEIMVSTKFQLVFPLLFFAFLCNQVNGQNNSPLDNQLRIGDIIPDILIPNIYHSPDSIISIKDLYKEKGLLINFWGTWCVPCIKELEFFATATPEYGLNILSVTHESYRTVESFLKRRPDLDPQLLNMVYNDTLLNNLFPHNTVPHEIWIDKNGVIKAITGGQDISHETIKLFLDGKEFDFIEKKEEAFDYTKPLSVPDSLIRYRSFFHGHRGEIGTNGFFAIGIPNSLAKPALYRFYGWNLNAAQLFWKAYNRGHRVNFYLTELITPDSTRFFFPEERDSIIFANSKYANGSGIKWPNDWKMFDNNWMKAKQHWESENLYSYDLIVSQKLSDSLFYEKVIAELEFNLNMKSSIVDKEKDCMVVTIKETGKKMLAKHQTTTNRDFWWVGLRKIDGRNVLVIQSAKLDDVLFWIHSATYGRKLGRQEPYFDETDFTERIDLEIDLGDGSNWPNQKHIENRLQQELGMGFHMAKRMYPVLIIKDNNL